MPPCLPTTKASSLALYLTFHHIISHDSSGARDTTRPLRLRLYLKNFDKLYQQNLDERARIEAQKPKRKRHWTREAPNYNDDTDEPDEDEMDIPDKTDTTCDTDAPDNTDAQDSKDESDNKGEPDNTDAPENTDALDNTDALNDTAAPDPVPCVPPVCYGTAQPRPSMFECQNIPEGTIVTKWFNALQADGSSVLEWCRGDVMSCSLMSSDVM